MSAERERIEGGDVCLHIFNLAMYTHCFSRRKIWHQAINMLSAQHLCSLHFLPVIFANRSTMTCL